MDIALYKNISQAEAKESLGVEKRQNETLSQAITRTAKENKGRSFPRKKA